MNTMLPVLGIQSRLPPSHMCVHSTALPTKHRDFSNYPLVLWTPIQTTFPPLSLFLSPPSLSLSYLMLGVWLVRWLHRRRNNGQLVLQILQYLHNRGIKNRAMGCHGVFRNWVSEVGLQSVGLHGWGKLVGLVDYSALSMIPELALCLRLDRIIRRWSVREICRPGR